MQFQTPATSQGVLCCNCQRYFGSSDMSGLCSSCFKKQLASSPEIPESQQVTESLDTMVAIAHPKKKKTKKKKNRCNAACCRKKLPIGMRTAAGACRCGGYFCNTHKLDHDCAHDYKMSQRKQLKKSNTKIVNQQMEKV